MSFTAQDILKTGIYAALLTISFQAAAVPLPNKWLFAGFDDVHSTDLWITDGTSAGTKLLADLRVDGPFAPSDPCCMTAFLTGKVLFFANAPGFDQEPWITDGTVIGTVPLFKALPLDYGSFQFNTPRYTTLGNGKALFTIRTTQGAEPWVTDGTTSGTHILKNINLSSGGTGDSLPDGYTRLSAGKAIFSAEDSLHGRELWVTDGTNLGTHLVKNIVPDIDSSNPTSITSLANGKAVFYVGNNIFVTDGTSAGTKKIKQINTLLKEIPNGLSSFQSLKKGVALFGFVPGSIFVDKTNHGLWKTDGTTIGTKLLNSQFTYFEGFDYLSNGKALVYGYSSLWVTDGTALGTKSLNITYNGHWSLGAGKVVFNHTDDIHGEELWITDGTVAGTKLVKDIYPGKTSSFPRSVKALNDGKGLSLGNGKGIFWATDPFNGFTLYITDGTKAGTVLLKNTNLKLYSAINSNTTFFPFSFSQ